nr:glycosyltransferase [Microlunatus panaciterrae]
MINTACATSGPILDAAYARLGIPGSHSVTAEKISVETEELRLHDFLFASNPEVESSLSGVGVRPEQILRTTFGWTPERLAPRGTTTPHSGVRVLFVGTLSVRKGIPELLEAWRASNVDGELVLAGAMTPEVAELVRDHAKSGTIRTPGFVKDVANLFRGADIFAFPTLEEGGPQVTYEAAGCGLPVITTPMGAARLVETGITGMVVDPGSVSQLTEALNVLGSKADLREACGEQARRKADDFTYPRVAAQRASLLIGALRSRRRRQ